MYYCDVYAFTMVLRRVNNDDDWIYGKMVTKLRARSTRFYLTFCRKLILRHLKYHLLKTSYFYTEPPHEMLEIINI